MYEEKLKQEGLTGDLSEKDLFLRVYFRGLDERQEIQRQLMMSTDRQLPWTFREGATLDRVAEQVKRHGVLSKAEEPYAQTFKAGLPMQMNQLRNARKEVHRKVSAMKARQGRSLTRAEKSAIVDEQYTLLEKQGVISALKLKQGNRGRVRHFAGNFNYKQVNSGRKTSKLPHLIKLLEQGSVGAGLVEYPWSRDSGRTSGHAVILRDYDPRTKEFVVTNPWWVGSFGFKRYDRINAKEFMRYLETYGWLQDTRPVAMRKSGPSDAALARMKKGKHSAGRQTPTKSVGKGFLAKLFAKRPPKTSAKPSMKVAKVKETASVAKVDKTRQKGLLWKLFKKKTTTATVQVKPVSREKKIKKSSDPAVAPQKKGLLYKLFKKSSRKKAAEVKLPVKPRHVKKPEAVNQTKPAGKSKGLLDKWFQKFAKKKS